MDALRNTINTQSIKTKQIVYQNPDGTFPEPGAILNVTDTRGHTDWTRDPNLDTITLVDASGFTGTLSYTYDDNLMVNGVPIGGGGGGMVSGGTNIDVTGPAGNRVVAFNPAKTPAGVDMLSAPISQATEIGFGGLFSNTAKLSFDPMMGLAGGLKITNPSNRPELRVSAGNTYIAAHVDITTNSNNITMETNDPNSASTIRMVNGGTEEATVSFNKSTDKLSIACDNNVSIFSSNSTQTIEMGPGPSGIIVGTQDTPIILQRKDAGGINTDTYVAVKAAGVVQIGETDVSTNPILKFQSVTHNATITLDDASNNLVISSSTPATTSLQIGLPLRDGGGSLGSSGQVLTSQGAGLPPVWADASGGGGGPLESITYTTPSVSTIRINNTTFPSVPISATTVTLEVTLQAGGGGGGGGLGIGEPSVGGVMSSGGGGGGGSGYAQTFTVTLPYDVSCNLTIGAGGTGGGGAQILLGSFDAGAGSNGGDTIFDISGGGTTSVLGGGGGGGGSGTGGLQAGGAGAVAGTGGSFNVSGAGAAGGDDGAGNVFGGAGGGIYGGFGGINSAGGSYTIVAPPAGNMAGGQGLGGAAAYSGAGGGGGSGGAGSYGQTGGTGAGGYIKIDVMSFT